MVYNHSRALLVMLSSPIRGTPRNLQHAIAFASADRGQYMHGNISYQFTSGTGSEADDGQWLVFAAIALLTTALVLCAAGIVIDPGLLLWPEPTFVGP
jgi:hypothetical protein